MTTRLRATVALAMTMIFMASCSVAPQARMDPRANVSGREGEPCDPAQPAPEGYECVRAPDGFSGWILVGGWR